VRPTIRLATVGTGNMAAMDAITLLKEDHRTVEDLFKKFEQTTDRAKKTRAQLVDRIIKELSVHAEIEELIFYPAVRAALPDADEDVLEALEEHHVAKSSLAEIERMTPDDERFRAKVAVLIESVRHHVKEEERGLFPKVRKALGRNDLAVIGESLKEAKKTAPTRPHPHAPDQPPAKVAASAAGAVLDQAREKGMEVVKEIQQRVN
jgi:hemerythrin superfamily protein